MGITFQPGSIGGCLDAIVSLVKKWNVKCWRMNKFELPLPKSEDDILAIKWQTDSILWNNNIIKEAKQMHVVHVTLEDGRQETYGLQFVNCHIILTQHGRLVLKSQFCCRRLENVCTSLMLVSLNLLDMMPANIMNTYISALHKEKIWTTLWSKFGRDKGINAIIVRAL